MGGIVGREDIPGGETSDVKSGGERSAYLTQ